MEVLSNIVQLEDYENVDRVIYLAEQRWGVAFDERNTLNDWVAYVNIYLSRATAIENRANLDVQYDALMKAAGLALTAAARTRRKDVPRAMRHYDVLGSGK